MRNFRFLIRWANGTDSNYSSVGVSHDEVWCSNLDSWACHILRLDYGVW